MKPTAEKRERKSYSAREKCQAVLSLWTQSRKPVAITREMGVSWTLLNNWQGAAMRGMLLALSPRVDPGEKSPAVPPRLQKLLDVQMQKKQNRLEKRLQKLQEAAKAPQKE